MDEDIEFNLRMIDQLSGPSRAMDQSLSALDQALKRERAELTATEAALRSMAKASVVDVEAHRAMSAQAQSQRDSVARLNQALHEHGSSAAQASAATKRLSEEAKRSSDSLLQSASDAASSSAGLEGLAADAGALLNPFTLAAAAVTGFGAALGYAATQGVELSLGAAQAKDDVMDSLSLVLDTQDAVAETYDGLEGISSKLGASVSSTQKIAEAVSLAGISSKDAMLDAVMAIQTAGKFSESAGSKIQSIIEKAGASGKFNIADKAFKGSGVSSQDVVAQLAAQTGRSIPVLKAQMKAGQITAEEGVAALTKAVDVKLGAGAVQKGRGFDESIVRLKNSLSTLFEDVNISPFEDEMARLADMFDTTTTNGQHLRDMLKEIFDGTFQVLADFVLGVRSGILDLEIIFYSLQIALKPITEAWEKAFPPETKQAVEDYGTAAKVAEIGVLFLATVVGVLATSLGIAAVSLALFMAPFALMGALAFAAGYGVYYLVNQAVDAVKWLGKMGTTVVKAGEDLIDGLIAGIEAKAAALIKSIKGVGKAAIDAFRNVFDSHSPSRVMMSIGADVSEGLAVGADAARPERHLRLVASRSVDAMSDVLSSRRSGLPETMGESILPARAGAPSHGGGDSRSSSSLDLSGMRVEINGVKDAEDVPDLLMETFANAFEQGTLIMGSRPAPRAA